MKSGVSAGAIAGVVGGVISVIFGFLGDLIRLLPPVDIPFANLVIIPIVLTIIFGAIFGVIYSKFYDSIPGKGVSKGLYFGLLLWFVSSIVPSTYNALILMEIPIAIGNIYMGFFTTIPFGLAIGYLYKKE